STEQRGEVGVVAGAALLGVRELLLDPVNDVGRDQCRHRPPAPLLTWALAVAETRSHRPQRRFALGSRPHARGVAIGGPGRGRVFEDAPYTRPVPTRPARGREHAGLGESQGKAVHGGTWVEIPGEHLLDDGGCGRVEVQTGRIPWMLGGKQVATR